MAGLSKYEGKDKRRMRLKNHIAKDLRSNKYGQRIVPDKRRHRDETDDYFNQEYGNDE